MHPQNIIVSLGLFCWLITSLAGCDWRLRGSGAGSSMPSTVFLHPSNDGEQGIAVYRQIRATLVRKKAIAAREQADVQLILGKQIFSRRTISVNKNARAAEFQLLLTLPFSILSARGGAWQRSVASSTQSYRFDERDIVAKHKEEQQLRDEMVRDIAHQILRQLQP